MKISQTSGVPIYTQIADDFRNQIMTGKISEGSFLPSIRSLAKELRISVITTMKAYEVLEEEGLIVAVQGKGFLVNPQNTDMMREQYMRQVEEALQNAIQAAEIANLSDQELKDTLEMLLRLRDEK